MTNSFNPRGDEKNIVANAEWEAHLKTLSINFVTLKHNSQ